VTGSPHWPARRLPAGQGIFAGPLAVTTSTVDVVVSGGVVGTATAALPMLA
jgi:hypothetical protein